jgi:tetratricopeptide (TPR) repeat protein
MRRLRSIGAILATCGGLLIGGPAGSDQTDPRLNDLFAQLRSAPGPAQASEIEARIWSIWSETGDAEMDKVYRIGNQALAIGDLATALKIFDSVVARAPSFAEGWNKRATIYYLMGRYHESLDDIGRTLELEPQHFGALAGLGLVNMELDRDEAALDAFERVLRVTPQSPTAKANIAFVKQRIKDKSI